MEAAADARRSGGLGGERVAPGEERLDELVGVELAEIGGTLADADVAHGQLQLVGDGEDDAALRRAIELRQHDARELDGFLELLCLLERVLAYGFASGAERATLEVRRSNDPARLLYERFGFAVAGIRRAYYTKPVEDALVLWKEGLATARRP